MGWFSKKQEKSADDALVERTLAVAQQVAQETPEDEQALLAIIDGIKMMPDKPSSAVRAPRQPDEISPPRAMPSADKSSNSRSVPTPVAKASASVSGERKPAAAGIWRKSAPPVAAPLVRQHEPKSAPRVNAALATSADGLKQSDMRREIAARVQNFKAHQQRLNDEREARIKKIYAEMQAHLQASDARKSPPAS